MKVVFISKINNFSKKKAIVSRIPFCFVFFKRIGFTFIATIYSDVSLSVVVNGPLNSTLLFMMAKKEDLPVVDSSSSSKIGTSER